jgi:hypothetical protein
VARKKNEKRLFRDLLLSTATMQVSSAPPRSDGVLCRTFHVFTGCLALRPLKEAELEKEVDEQEKEVEERKAKDDIH